MGTDESEGTGPEGAPAGRPVIDIELDELLSHRPRPREEVDDLYDGEW